MPKFSKKEIDNFRFNQISQRLSQTAPIAVPTKISHWNRLFTRIIKAFSKKHKEEKNLSGRIQQLKNSTDELIGELHNIQADLLGRNDSLLLSFLSTIIRPLIKEHQSIISALHSKSAATQAKAFKNYGEWIERAERWTAFYTRSENKEKIIQAILEQSLADSFKHIDRDLQVIHEYLIHQVENLVLSQEDVEKIYLKIDRQIKPQIDFLQNLRKVPDDITLDIINDWKIQINLSRSKCYNEALAIIDSIVDEYAPLSASQEQHFHLHEVFTEINSLEENLFSIQNELTNYPYSDPQQSKKNLHTRLAAIEEAAHLLNLDLRLTNELCDRLQNILDTLHSIERDNFTPSQFDSIH